MFQVLGESPLKEIFELEGMENLFGNIMVNIT